MSGGGGHGIGKAKSIPNFQPNLGKSMSIVIGGHGFLLMTDNANLQTQYANFAGGHGRQGGSLRLSGSGSQTGGGQIGGSGVGNGGGIGKELDEELDEELERDGGPTDELDEELDEELEGGGGPTAELDEELNRGGTLGLLDPDGRAVGSNDGLPRGGLLGVFEPEGLAPPGGLGGLPDAEGFAGTGAAFDTVAVLDPKRPFDVPPDPEKPWPVGVPLAPMT